RPAEGQPAKLDGLEASGDSILYLFAKAVGFVEENRAIGLDAVAVAAAQQTGDRLVADFAHEIPEGDVDAADRVLDGAAPALPKSALPQPLGDARRLVGPLADQHWPEQLDRSRRQRLARVRAAAAGQ